MLKSWKAGFSNFVLLIKGRARGLYSLRSPNDRDQERAIWSRALIQCGLERLEKHVGEHMSVIFSNRADVYLPFDASADGLAQVVGFVLEELLSGDRPLLSGYRVMNCPRLQALCQIRVSLAEALLRDSDHRVATRPEAAESPS